MDDALSKWSSEVAIAAGVAGTLDEDIEDLKHELEDLIDALGDLDIHYMPSHVEDYEILSKADSLSGLVVNGTDQARGDIQTARRSVSELRRAVEFYRL